MKSVRINKDGREVTPQSFIAAYEEAADDYEAWWNKHNRPTCQLPTELNHRKFNPGNDSGWSNKDDLIGVEELRQRYPVVQHRSGTLLSDKTHVNLINHLQRMARFTPGSWFCFDSYAPDSPSLTTYLIHYIIAVENDFDKVVWPNGMRPKTHLVTNAGNCAGTNIRTWTRWGDMAFCRPLTHGEQTRLVENNVQLQDHILRLRQEYEAGTLTIGT